MIINLIIIDIDLIFLLQQAPSPPPPLPTDPRARGLNRETISEEEGLPLLSSKEDSDRSTQGLGRARALRGRRAIGGR